MPNPLRTVIFACGHRDEADALCQTRPLSMTPLLDRPFIQHVVEYLAAHDVTEVDIVLSHLPQAIEEHLDDGARWGMHFRYHLARSADTPYGLLRSILADTDDQLLIGHACRLPDLARADLMVPGDNRRLVACDPGTSTETWTGWARLRRADLPTELDLLDETAFGDALAATVPDHRVAPPLSVATYEDVLSSQFRALTGQFQGLLSNARQPDESIWIGRNVSLHPTARILPPVFIGENCDIGPRVALGPNAAINANCILDSGCMVADSLVLPDSYVGEGLELSEVIIDRNLLLNVRFGTAVTVVDDFILSSLQKRTVRASLASLMARVVAGVCFILGLPLLLATVIVLRLHRGAGKVVSRRRCVYLPATDDERLWRTVDYLSFLPDPGDHVRPLGHLVTQFLPGLWSVARGRLHLVGVRPRTAEEIAALPPDWRALYLQSKAGLLTEAYILYGAHPSEDELYGSEAFYAVQTGPKQDLRIIFQYVLTLCHNAHRQFRR